MSKWVIHITKVDDVTPVPDELTALRVANDINRLLAEMNRTEHMPICYAIVKDAEAEVV